jgi:hypothetical protein
MKYKRDDDGLFAHCATRHHKALVHCTCLPSAAEVAHVLDKLGQNIENSILPSNYISLEDVGHPLWVGILMVVMHVDISISYNSCRNRHCPKCQGKTEDWIQARQSELLVTLFSCGFLPCR